MSPNKVHWSFDFLRENQRLQDFFILPQTSQADHSKRLDLLRILDNEMKVKPERRPPGRLNYKAFKHETINANRIHVLGCPLKLVTS